MNKYYFSSILLLLLVSPVLAQRTCYSPQVTNQKRSADPIYDNQIRMTEEGLKKFVASGQVSTATGNRAIRTIPVVVHVLYNTSSQNVSTSAIQAKIDLLNQDYRKLNADLAQARSVVRPFAADAEIQFCLAQQTPTGQPTTGIDRVATAEVCFDPNTESDKMKSSSTNGVNAWDTRYYLNFWIVNLCGNTQFSGIGGYAYLPTPGMHGSSIDGVVIDYNWGMMAGDHAWTHEVGHYLGLHHTWGDLSGNACGNVFPSTDDGFSDTPDSKDPNYGCTPIFSCTGNSAYGDLLEDFMDYSNCSVLFTTQQVNYMNNVLTNTRSSLLSTNVCSATGAPLAGFTANPTLICVGQTVTFTNTSSGSGNTYSWTFTGGTPSSSTATNPTVTYNTAGTYTVSLTATNSNGSNTNTQTNLIVVSGSNSLPLIEGFENTTFPPAGWSVTNSDASTTWVRTTAASGFGTSSACAYVNNYSYNAAGQKDWLITPVYNFSIVSGGRLKWDYAYAPYSSPGYYDSLEVLYSTNCGTTWTSLWKKGGSGLGTATATNTNFVPNASQWKRDSISLASLSGQPSVRFAFKNANQYGNNIFIDNVNIYNTITTPQAPVADFIGTPTTVVVGNTVSFTDISTNTPTGWSWTFTGGTPAGSTQQNPVITYNTIGTYSVSLIASNTVGNNSITKTAYINVIQGGGCDTLDNISATDTAVYYLVPGALGSGYVSGNNSFGDLAKAEFYTNSQTRQVTGAYYLFARAVVNGTGSIQACIWDASGTGGSPGTTPLVSVPVNISTIIANIASQSYTFVNFPSPPTVTGNFYAGFILPTGAGDTVAIATTTISSPSVGQGWEQYGDGTWHTYTEFWAQYIPGFELSNLVFPIVCTPSTAPAASFTASNTAVCVGSTINFTSTSTGNPTSYSWTFTGGSPSTSTSANPSVTYNTSGTYNVSLSVSNSGGNNTATQNNYITVYTRPTLATSTNPVLCYGGSTGSATVTATGGTPVYTYNWSGGGTSASITNKAAGTYTVTVSDSHQCSSTTSVNISQPLAPLSLVPNASDAVCNQQNGTVSVNATGGAGGYSYLWNTGGNTQTLNNVGPGAYSVTVNDVNSCSGSATMIVNNTTSNFAVSITAENASCGINDGSAVAIPNNGTFGVTYIWSTGSISGAISSLAPGTYSVTVTNNVGCTASATSNVSNVNGPTTTMNVTNGTCQGGGQIDLVISGGTPPFSFAWSHGATIEDVQNLPAGTYTVTVTDVNNCVNVNTATVTDTSPVSVSFTTQNPTAGSNNGSVTANPASGTPPYTYQWSNGGTTQTISNLAAGTYTVTVTDYAGCKKISSVTLSIVSGIVQAEDFVSISIYPNPVSHVCYAELELLEANSLSLFLFNSLGQPVWAKQLSGFKQGIVPVDMRSLPAGVYFFRVSTENSSLTRSLIKE